MDEQKTAGFACAHCGAIHPREELHEFDDELYCLDCLEALTEVCDYCGERFRNSELHHEQGLTLCHTCLEDEYSYCSSCGRLVQNDEFYYLDDGDDDGYCERCYDARREGIQSYSYKPTPIFYGDGERYFGVELEIDSAGERHDHARRLMNIGNAGGQKRIYIKHDGSLEDGMEIVTHPMTLKYHLNEMPWPEVLDEAIHMGYLSHKACTCGLHVHVNRDAFGDSLTEQEEVIARILFFVENHWNELLRFSRRSRLQMEQWAARYGRKDDPKAVLDQAKRNYQRYQCVNLTNYRTIEFRMFRGTLKLNTLLATLQMVDRICEVALYLSDEEMQDLTWTDFVASCTAPELVQYLKERRLYVSEPVESEVEV